MSLDKDQWAEVERLFARAGAIAPEQRADFLDRECQDPVIRDEVRSLLEYEVDHLQTLEAAIAAEAAVVSGNADPDGRLIGARLGPYRIEAIAGHGGMGAVYGASRADGEFQQQVAIKLVRAAAQSPSALERFKQERQILARLAHTNIARLLDGGSTPEGIPYLVMEFIEGDPIIAWCRRQSLSLDQRLRLFLNVCQGVAFAHRHFVVHRDLKPANILVTAEGVPKLLDFGIAKMTASDDLVDGRTLGPSVMTPEYAAPEQVRGDPVTMAVDIYALGLILYEMLTGQKAQNVADCTPATLTHAICERDPRPPASWNPELAGDLDNIIRKAIRKEPARRYASVDDLADDIRRHLDGHRVSARPDTPAYRLSKFLRRNRAAVAGGLIASTVFAGVALMYWLAKPGRLPRAGRITQITQTGHIEGRGLTVDGSYLYFIQNTAGQSILARVPVDGGSPETLRNLLQHAYIHDISPDRTRLLLSIGTGTEVPLFEFNTATAALRRVGDMECHSAAWSPDGRRLAISHGHSIFIANEDGAGLRKILDTPGDALSLRWSPAGRSTALRFTVVSADGHRSALWEVQSDGTNPRPVQIDGDSGPAKAPLNDYGSWMAQGRYFLFRSFAPTTYSIWIMREGPRFLDFSPRPPTLIHSTSAQIASLTPSLDGRRVFFTSAQERRQFARFDSARGEFVPYLPGVAGRWLNFSRDGASVAYTTNAPETLWRARADGSEPLQLTHPPLRVYRPRWSPDGAWIAFTGFTAGQSYGVYVVSANGGDPQRITPAGVPANDAAWSPDGGLLLFFRSPTANAAPHGLFVMDWKSRKITSFPGPEKWQVAAWSPDGRRIALTNGFSSIEILDTRTHRSTPLANNKAAGVPFWSRNGRYIYYQDMQQDGLPILRASIDGNKVERMMSSKQIPQSDLSAYVLVGLDPGDSPVVSLVRNNSDIYALELELP